MRDSDIEDRDDDFREHYDASQFRLEAWNELKHLTARLDRAALRGVKVESATARVRAALDVLRELEWYFCFPGDRAVEDLEHLLDNGMSRNLSRQAARLTRMLVSESYRTRDVTEIFVQDDDDSDRETDRSESLDNAPTEARPYFELLVVDDIGRDQEIELRRRLLALRRPEDPFIYDVLVATSAEDALIAVQCNHNIQSCVLRYSFPLQSAVTLAELRDDLHAVDAAALNAASDRNRAPALGRALKSLRPELDLFLNTDEPVEHVAGEIDSDFRRVFYGHEDFLELHLSILKGIGERYETPFFSALKQHSLKPTGMFHALPISRGKSITRSHWIRDMARFYGTNIFMAETSATSGGLDSLLQPHGPLKRSQELAARAFGARRTYFVTNGTSAANKIVMQALIRPGDVVLVSRDCHKSHHYALVLAGAYPIYLDPYPLNDYTMYGAVGLRAIKEQMLALRRDGRLDRLRLALLTNCTFDGIMYHPAQVMRELLAIKPDLIFLWDEAWFAFARFLPPYRQRTAMHTGRQLEKELRSPAYRAKYEAWKNEFDAKDPTDDATWLDEPLLPDPARARVRIYATQSTHKTLTSLRQGSMIHVRDQDFERLAEDSFQEAYMTYTSTSPNYQILASLDVGRRQVELEGYEMVKRTVQLAMLLRRRIEEHPLLCKHFGILKVRDVIPAGLRASGIESFYDAETGFERMEDAFSQDELALDPTRVTLHVGHAGIEGDAFKQMLMDRFDIQVNKTSRNTVLFIVNIGTTRGSVAYLLKVLVKIAQELDDRIEHHSPREHRIHEERVASLTERLPPLPNFSHFHAAFRPWPDASTPEGDLRAAYFLAYDERSFEYLTIDEGLPEAMATGREVVSASFVTPYPPGFPVLVPGQVISEEILAYMRALDVKEIHGYRPAFGFRVFTEAALRGIEKRRAAAEPVSQGTS
ncbi:MAG: ornithine decarboxylase [Planctomycetes bacterium]|nr:ornithine decarboxylase [Planctomycetota bacterium]